MQDSTRTPEEKQAFIETQALEKELMDEKINKLGYSPPANWDYLFSFQLPKQEQYTDEELEVIQYLTYIDRFYKEELPDVIKGVLEKAVNDEERQTLIRLIRRGFLERYGEKLDQYINRYPNPFIAQG